MFEVVKTKRPELPDPKTLLFTDHEVVVNLVKEDDIDHFLYAEADADELTAQFRDLMNVHQQGPSEGVVAENTTLPTFMFIHYDFVDHAGHAFGWGSTPY